MLSHLSRGGLITALAAIGCLLIAGTVGVATRSDPPTRADGAHVAVESKNDATRGRARGDGPHRAGQRHDRLLAGRARRRARAAPGHSPRCASPRTTASPIAGRFDASNATWQSTASTRVRRDLPRLRGRRRRGPCTRAVDDVVPHARAGRDRRRDRVPFGRASTSASANRSCSASITTSRARTRVRDLLSHLDVTESTPVLGGWHWFSDTELHFRPKEYWPANEQITCRVGPARLERRRGRVGRRSRARALLHRRPRASRTRTSRTT